MKSQEQIQRAHDILHALLESEPCEKGGPIHASHDVLSWVLDGPCKGSFDVNLAMVMGKMEAAGYHLVERKERKCKVCGVTYTERVCPSCESHRLGKG